MAEEQTIPSGRGGSNSMIVGIIIIIVLAALAFFALNKKTAPSTPQVIPTQQASPQQQTTDANQQEVREIKVSGKDFTFDKKEIRVKKGEKVRIVFTSMGGMHDFAVDEFNAKTKVVSTGQTSETEFTADKTGSFEYYCDVGNHRAMGMVGTLIVE